MFNKVFAQDYSSLVPEIQGVANQLSGGTIGSSGNNLNALLNQWVYIIIGAAVVLAIFMIIRGGYLYMTSSDNANKKTEAKNRIKAALGGLLLALGAVLILNTINPSITQFTIMFPNLTKPVFGSPSYVFNQATNTYSNPETGATFNADGSYSTTPSRVAIDTDGRTRPPFNDPHYQSQTSLPGLDANVDNYVVVPIGSDVPLGSRVFLENRTTGQSAWAIVGDRGPTANGLGEMSLNAARSIGAWSDGMGNSARQHQVQWTFYPNSAN